ncbi:hypothetical protein DXF96_14145 [Heyndrickxia coagulans]|nr:hypothetical protein CIW84_09530 [Heyndrickxia coagulans]AVD56131.1 hypothetical protein C3766_08305 [Heyndrickxia coagulans]AWP37043.1 hypothetical protein CYJ15_08625 [Heyndrickxia coagulans]OZV97730.1 hypothetical protein CAY57_00745 [Heyndrickxia coagulans]QDI62541.1 hypothetical protein DXF96_14145 [Heyndrickxia coagulans]
MSALDAFTTAILSLPEFANCAQVSLFILCRKTQKENPACVRNKSSTRAENTGCLMFVKSEEYRALSLGARHKRAIGRNGSCKLKIGF